MKLNAEALQFAGEVLTHVFFLEILKNISE